jgi:hypothetical protein
MAETRVFKLNLVVNKCYEHAEYTHTQGEFPNKKLFTNVPPRYVGKFIRYEQGGWGDDGWRRDYFRDLNGNENVVNSVTGGTTCFREVPCSPPRLPPEHLETIQNRNHVPTLKSLAFAQLPTHTVSEVRKNFNTILGGKTRKRCKKSKRKNKSKRRQSKKYLKTK